MLRRLFVASTARCMSLSNGIGRVPNTAAIVLIGDELLNRRVIDANGPYLHQRLTDAGLAVRRLVTIGDDERAIADEVRRCADSHSVVVTSGGIGPTHDDVTYAALASAFESPLVLNAAIAQLVKRYVLRTKSDDAESRRLAGDETSAMYKLARIPQAGELVYPVPITGQPSSVFPIVRVDNVFVFPGVPMILRRALDGSLPAILRVAAGDGSSTREAKALRTVFVMVDEFQIADDLETLHVKYPTVTIGSYPEFFNNYFKVKVTFEASQEADVEKAVAEFVQLHGDKVLCDHNANPLLYGDVGTNACRQIFNDAFLTEIFSDRPDMIEKIGVARQTMLDAYRRYGQNSVCVSFTGGKDCTVTLHLWRAIVDHVSNDDAVDQPNLTVFTVRGEDSFAEVDHFVDATMLRYRCAPLQSRHTGDSIKDALRSFLAQNGHIRAVVMGVRRTDPHGARLNAFSPTDGDWPALMRINPILDWTYGDVWTFLRRLHIPYCPLYDRGYTSFGDKSRSKQNDALLREDGSYAPAHELRDELKERASRLSSPKTNGSGGGANNNDFHRM